jgi:hypothetical protein
MDEWSHILSYYYSYLPYGLYRATRILSLKSLLHFCHYKYKASYLLIRTDFRLFCCLELIDQVLEQDDLDKDGYLSYVEYVLGRKKDENKMQQKHNKP